MPQPAQVVELNIAALLKVSAVHFQLQPERERPMTQELDIQQFINDAQDAVPSDQRVVSPAGEYSMYIKPGSTKIITGEGEKGLWAMYTAQAVIDSPEVREATNLENPSARVAFFLDITEASTKERVVLAQGVNRNTRLGALLKATGNDKPGWSYGAIEGVSFVGKVVQKADKRNPEQLNAEVAAFTRA